MRPRETEGNRDSHPNRDTVTVEEIDFEIARDNPAAVQLSKILRLEQMPQLTMNLSGDDERQVNFLVTLVKQLHEQAGKEGHPITIEGVLDKVHSVGEDLSGQGFAVPQADRDEETAGHSAHRKTHVPRSRGCNSGLGI